MEIVEAERRCLDLGIVQLNTILGVRALQGRVDGACRCEALALALGGILGGVGSRVTQGTKIGEVRAVADVRLGGACIHRRAGCLDFACMGQQGVLDFAHRLHIFGSKDVSVARSFVRVSPLVNKTRSSATGIGFPLCEHNKWVRCFDPIGWMDASQGKTSGGTAFVNLLSGMPKHVERVGYLHTRIIFVSMLGPTERDSRQLCCSPVAVPHDRLLKGPMRLQGDFQHLRRNTQE